MNGINDLPTVSPLREAPATIKKKIEVIFSHFKCQTFKILLKGESRTHRFHDICLIADRLASFSRC